MNTALPLQAQNKAKPNAELLWSDAHTALNHLEYGRASEQFSEYIRLFPAQALAKDADYSLGFSELKQTHYSAATRAFKRALTSKNPEVRSKSQLGLVECYFYLHEKALGMLTAKQSKSELSAQTGTNPELRHEAWLLEILMLTELGHWDQATQSQRALQAEFPVVPPDLVPLASFVQIRISNSTCAKLPETVDEISTTAWMDSQGGCLIDQSEKWLSQLRLDSSWNDLSLKQLQTSWKKWSAIPDQPPLPALKFRPAQAKAYIAELKPLLKQVRTKRAAQLNEMIQEKKDSLTPSALLYSRRLAEEITPHGSI